MILKNKNPFVNMRLQKVTVGILCLVLVGLASCVKQKNCDCGLKGKFIYYETPQENLGCGAGEYYAIFIPDDQHLGSCRIYSDIPKKFQTKDTISVSVCFNIDPSSAHNAYSIDCRKYKIKCIEKED